MKKIVSRSFFADPTVVCAQKLLGCCIITTINGIQRGGRIVETEAYCGQEDPACHAACGPTVRNASLFGPVGHLYVYLSYGIHYCCNIVAHTAQEGSGGVLIRAIEPLWGIEDMVRARGRSGKELANGPGKVGQALGITREFDGIDILTTSEVSLFIDTNYKPKITATPRIGISKGVEHLWRFIDLNKREFISKAHTL